MVWAFDEKRVRLCRNEKLETCFKKYKFGLTLSHVIKQPAHNFTCSVSSKPLQIMIHIKYCIH